MNQPSYQPSGPFEEAITGWTANPESLEDWPNTVTVRSTEGYMPNEDGLYPRTQDRDIDDDYADQTEQRQLVEVDTNYKPTRPGQHPVLLSRPDAIQFAAHVLAAVEDTFHYSRIGRLRAVEAAELLRLLPEVEGALAQLRAHALDDLLRDTGSDPDDQPEVEDEVTEEGGPHE